MKKILVVFAHPDDEGAIAGTLAFYARQGVHVSLACVTLGEAGEISDPSLATPENLGAVREQELRCACEVIGIRELHLLDYCDSGMIDTPENDLRTAFIQAEPDEVRFKLVELIRQSQPQVVITFEPDGWYGHPDHIAAGRYATEAYSLAGDPQAYPAAGAPWQPERLYHAAFLRADFQKMVEWARLHGIDAGGFDDVPVEEPDPLADQITHTLDIRAYFETKEAAMACHRTQFGEENLFRRMPPEIKRQVMGREYFIQVHPAPQVGGETSSDLFEG